MKYHIHYVLHCLDFDWFEFFLQNISADIMFAYI